jgi:hypothetical protein
MSLSIARLLPIRAQHCVTITHPLRPSDPDRDRVRIELRHAAEAVDTELEALGLDAELRQAMLAPVHALFSERPDVPRDGMSLVALLTPEKQELHVVDWDLPARVTVADRFALADLIAEQTSNPPFYTLALSDAGAQLLRVTGQRVTVVKLPLERTDRAAANAERVSPTPGGSQHANTHGAGMSGSPKMTAQGFGHEDRDAIERDAWYYYVNKALEAVFATRDEPIVLVADVVHHHRFRAICKVANLKAKGVEFNPANATHDEIVERARAIMHSTSPRRSFAERGDKPHTEKLVDVLMAARSGRVETLYFVPGQPRPGVLSDDAIKPHDTRRPGDVDLVSEAVRLTLKSGGDIVPVTMDELADSAVHATLRWVPGA